MNVLTLVAFARDAYIKADAARDVSKDEAEGQPEVAATIADALKSACLTYMGTLELAGIVDNEVAVKVGSMHWYDERVPSLVRTVRPEIKGFQVGMRVRSKFRAIEGEIVEVDKYDPALAQVVWDDGRQALASLGMCEPVVARPAAGPVHQGVEAAEFARVAGEVASVGRTGVVSTDQPMKFNTMYLPREKTAADPIS